MFKNSKARTLGVIALIIVAIFVSLSAVQFPAGNDVAVPVTGNSEGLAAYHRSEQAAYVENQKGLELYYQSERGQARFSESNEIGLAQYYPSERGMYGTLQNGLDIYHQSEWNTR